MRPDIQIGVARQSNRQVVKTIVRLHFESVCRIAWDAVAGSRHCSHSQVNGGVSRASLRFVVAREPLGGRSGYVGAAVGCGPCIGLRRASLLCSISLP